MRSLMLVGGFGDLQGSNGGTWPERGEWGKVTYSATLVGFNSRSAAGGNLIGWN